MAKLREILRFLHARYDPATAEEWDRVGLVCGDPDEDVSDVLFAVDADDRVVDEAIALDVQLLVTHHPLLLRGVHSVAADTPKGRIVHRLIRHGIALVAAHTNADHASPGVSDAIARALGLVDLRPITAAESAAMDKYVVMVPRDSTQTVIDSMAAAGAGRLGEYERAAFWSPGTGTFRPLAGANPTIGAVGEIEQVAEDALQMIAPRSLRAPVLSALREAHPYEEPAFEVLELAQLPGGIGAGRIGELEEPIDLRSFAARVASVLPATAGGVRVAGSPDGRVQRVALCGGAGDSLLAEVRAAAPDVYLTSDLRHHPAGEHLAAGGCALVDVAHWAAEWMWLPQAADLLVADAAAAETAITTTVSLINTDPWSFHVGSPTNAR